MLCDEWKARILRMNRRKFFLRSGIKPLAIDRTGLSQWLKLVKWQMEVSFNILTMRLGFICTVCELGHIFLII